MLCDPVDEHLLAFNVYFVLNLYGKHSVACFAKYTVFKNRTPKTGGHNFIKIGPLYMIFHRIHRRLIAD